MKQKKYFRRWLGILNITGRKQIIDLVNSESPGGKIKIEIKYIKNNDSETTENQAHTQKILNSATAKREHYLEVKKKSKYHNSLFIRTYTSRNQWYNILKELTEKGIPRFYTHYIYSLKIILKRWHFRKLNTIRVCWQQVHTKINA